MQVDCCRLDSVTDGVCLVILEFACIARKVARDTDTGGWLCRVAPVRIQSELVVCCQPVKCGCECNSSTVLG